MDDNRFFKFLWRFNALWIAGVALGVPTLLILDELFTNRLGYTETDQVISSDPFQSTSPLSQSVELGFSIDGKDTFIVLETANQILDRIYASSKSSVDNALNAGVFDPNTGTTSWFFPTNEQLILTLEPILDSVHGLADRPPPVIGFLITYVEKDTSGDKRSSFSDELKLMTIKVDGTSPEILLEGLTEPAQLRQPPTSSQSPTLFYLSEDGMNAARINRQSLKLEQIHSIAAPS